MSKVLSCRDVGVDCDFKARGNTVDEVVRKAAEHGRKEHGMKEIPEELKEKIKKAVRDE